MLVSTAADALVEANEVFEGVLTLLAGSERIILGNDRAMATIMDSSSEAMIFSKLICVHAFIYTHTSSAGHTPMYLCRLRTLTLISHVFR